MLDSIMSKLSQLWDDHGETVKTVLLTAVVYKTAEYASSTPQGRDDVNKFIGAFATGMAKRASESFSREDDEEDEDSEEIASLKEENEDLRRQVSAYKRKADIERVEAENARREKKTGKGSTTITQADVDDYINQF